MSQLDRLVLRLFGAPGRAEAGDRDLLGLAADAHLALLRRAAADSAGPAREALSRLLFLIERQPDQVLRRRLLLEPCLIEDLHALADESASLLAWHRCVAEPSIAMLRPKAPCAPAQPLGNSLLALHLRENPSWRGSIALKTDLCGRLRFPLSDWSIALCRPRDGPNAVLADERVTATLTRHDVRFSLDEAMGQELLVIAREDWLRMLLDDDDRVDGRRISSGRSEVTVRLLFAGAIPGWQVRYDPVLMADFDRHAGLTGGVVAAVLAAIRRHSPRIAAEFDRIMSAVRGWELAPGGYGTIQSFSDPTLPRVMGINVSYAADDEPLVCPFCFAWFGHELGHTKSYLIETILHVRGHSLTTSRGRSSGMLERYGRRLPMRALFQIPYTHVYEWVLMMDALEAGFSALPWTISSDPVAFGDEIQNEIDEAFGRLGREVEPTSCGRLALTRLRTLSDDVRLRWQLARRGAWRPSDRSTLPL